MKSTTILLLLILVVTLTTSTTTAFSSSPSWGSMNSKVAAVLSQRLSPLYSSTSSSSFQIAAIASERHQDGESLKGGSIGQSRHPIRTTLRRTTGLSLTAIRATLRAATGVSATAVYYSIVGFTSGIVRSTMSFIMHIFPAWFRYFFQPFLILYYVPLYMLRTWTSPKKRRERQDIMRIMADDVKRGVYAADAARESGYWPISMNENGWQVSFPPDWDITTTLKALPTEEMSSVDPKDYDGEADSDGDWRT